MSAVFFFTPTIKTTRDPPALSVEGRFQMLKVCLLSEQEAVRYRAGEKLVCRNHRHATTSEAAELASGARPMARWIDRRHVVLVALREWRPAWSDGFRVLQFLPVGAKGSRNPFQGN